MRAPDRVEIARVARETHGRDRCWSTGLVPEDVLCSRESGDA
jgi:hypothetical protein